MSRFVEVERDTAYWLPPSVQEWLPKDHLARYVVDVVEALDLSGRVRRYAGRGSDAHHPGTLLGLLIYGYATGAHASRAIERASYDSVAFRFVAGNTHPDHDTKAQVNLTDADSRIMKVQGNGFEQCYHAQLAVDMDSRLIVAPGLTQEVNDKQQIVPALEKLRALPPELGTVQALVADNGFMSEANVRACATPEVEDDAPIAPLIALGREPHHPDLLQRFAPEPFGPAPQDPVQAMAHRLRTHEGRALYALRKSTVEPVIGIIKSVMKFRQFLLRGVNNVSGEWDWVCLAYNVKRMHRMQCI